MLKMAFLERFPGWLEMLAHAPGLPTSAALFRNIERLSTAGGARLGQLDAAMAGAARDVPGIDASLAARKGTLEQLQSLGGEGDFFARNLARARGGIADLERQRLKAVNALTGKYQKAFRTHADLASLSGDVGAMAPVTSAKARLDALLNGAPATVAPGAPQAKSFFQRWKWPLGLAGGLGGGYLLLNRGQGQDQQPDMSQQGYQ